MDKQRRARFTFRFTSRCTFDIVGAAVDGSARRSCRVSIPYGSRITPDIAPLLALGAVTGMRRGELVGIRRSRIDWQRGAITVDTAVDGKRLKGTKTGEDRTCHVDDATLAMLRRLCDTQDKLAGVLEGFAADPFLFSSVPDAGVPLPPDYRDEARRSTQVRARH